MGKSPRGVRMIDGEEDVEGAGGEKGKDEGGSLKRKNVIDFFSK